MLTEEEYTTLVDTIEKCVDYKTLLELKETYKDIRGVRKEGFWMLFAQYGSYDLLKQALNENIVDTNMLDKEGLSILQYVGKSGNLDNILDLLESKRVEENEELPVWYYFMKGCTYEDLKRALDMKLFDPIKTTKNNMNGWHSMAFANDYKVLEQALDNKLLTDPDEICDDDGNNVFDWIGLSGRIEDIIAAYRKGHIKKKAILEEALIKCIDLLDYESSDDEKEDEDENEDEDEDEDKDEDKNSSGDEDSGNDSD